MKGRVLSFKHFAAQDGPGIRLVVFLKGCPLRCLWCHTPESQSGDPEVMYRREKCLQCGSCRNIFKCLPVSSPAEEQLKNIENCPVGAVTVAGGMLSAGEVVAEAEKERMFFEESGGGLTISGGEPLFQPEFTLEIARLACQRGIDCCIETCGHGSYEALSRLIPFTGLFLYDYKATGAELHRKLTGVDNSLILENLKRLNADGARIILRCPLIPEVNDQLEHLLAIAEIAEKYENVAGVHIEPFNPMARNKYAELNRPYAEDLLPSGFPGPEKVKYYVDFIKKHTGKKVEVP